MSDKYKILVVDDHAGNRLLLQYNLEGIFNVDLANSGLSAIEMFTNENYDLILMDINMPKMDGIEATKRICKIEDGHKRTPIFAVTSNIYKDQKAKCLEAGMDDYVTKPVHAKALIEKIESTLHATDF